jgi:predicted NUDIX family NTP pyrophosphohydrolase
MPKVSAGLLMYRYQCDNVQFFLVHPGGPLWAHKDIAAWSIPKGLLEAGEEPLVAAQREFEEETGIKPAGKFAPLDPVRQKGGKIIQAWAFEGDCDPSTIKSNFFLLEWPPGSGRFQEFPEVDRAGWFTLEDAKIKIHKGQVALLEELDKILRPETKDEQSPGPRSLVPRP